MAGAARSELIVIDACADSRRSLAQVIAALLPVTVIELPASPSAQPADVARQLAGFPGRSVLRLDDDVRIHEQSFGWRVLEELLWSDPILATPVLLSATPFERLGGMPSITRESLRSLGFSLFVGPLAWIDFLRTIAEPRHVA